MDNISNNILITKLNNTKLKLRGSDEAKEYSSKEIKLSMYLDFFRVRGSKIPLINVGNYLRVKDLKKLDPVARLYLEDRDYIRIKAVDITRIVGFYHIGLKIEEFRPLDDALLSLHLGDAEDEDVLLDALTNTVNAEYLEWWLEQDGYVHEKYKDSLVDQLKLWIKLK